MQETTPTTPPGRRAGLPALAALAAADPLRRHVIGYDSADGTHWSRLGDGDPARAADYGPGRAVRRLAGLFGDDQPVSSKGTGSGGGGPFQAKKRFDRVSVEAAGRRPPAGRRGAPLRGAHGRPVIGAVTKAAADLRGGTPVQAGVSGHRVRRHRARLARGGAVGTPSPRRWQHVRRADRGDRSGAMFITAEYRRGLIRVTLAASPRRGRILAAKAVVIGVAAFVVGVPAASSRRC